MVSVAIGPKLLEAALERNQLRDARATQKVAARTLQDPPVSPAWATHALRKLAHDALQIEAILAE
eukprot:3291114-Lingulodinium_polyedra.AAC.1